MAKQRSKIAIRRQRRQNERESYDLYAFVDACAVQPSWGGRDMLLFDGPIDAVDAIGSNDPGVRPLDRRSPQWWWPADRSWFVGTEIDYPWTYVTGSDQLIDRLLTTRGIESVRIESSDPW